MDLLNWISPNKTTGNVCFGIFPGRLIKKAPFIGAWSLVGGWLNFRFEPYY
jgi:hypothetical protein